MAPDNSLTLRDVTVRYGRRTALDRISGHFPQGSLTAIVGANGAGKSTLLAAIAGAVRPSSGTIERPGASHLAYLPQHAHLATDYPMTVAELIALGAWRVLGAFRGSHGALRRQVETAAETVGLANRLRSRIGMLSPGELQRAFFARLILQDAATILLDEPVAAVDARATQALLDQIARWHQEGRTIIAVLHDLALVRERFPETVVLAGRCLAWGPTETSLPAMAA